jgi:hypothetical protein
MAGISAMSGCAKAEFLSHSAVLLRTAAATGALTVAGQWRTFTAFPSILAITVMSRAVARGRGSDVMESTSMTSTFIDGPAREVKRECTVGVESGGSKRREILR